MHIQIEFESGDFYGLNLHLLREVDLIGLNEAVDASTLQRRPVHRPLAEFAKQTRIGKRQNITYALVGVRHAAHRQKVDLAPLVSRHADAWVEIG